MKIVIDIREDTYNTVCELGNGGAKVIDDAIKNGVVLPKNHGRLIDVDELLLKEKPVGLSDDIWIESHTYKILTNAPTIIEADNAGSEADDGTCN